MGYDIRPLATLASQARGFFTQAIPGAVVRLWANTFTVIGKVLALLDFEHELRRQYLYNQLFASTAAYQWLTRHGFELGLVPDSGTAATGSISATWSGDADIVPAGTQFERADGATYSTVAATPASGETVTLVIQADEAGAAYNVDAGDTLAIIETNAVPISLGGSGSADATVLAPGIAGGVDPEDVETFRARVLYRKRNPPQGGSAPDYVEWAGEALDAVKNVYVDSFANDARSVWLCFTVTDQANGIPTAAEVAAVQAYVSDPVRRPITARVFATAPTESTSPIAIHELRARHRGRPRRGRGRDRGAAARRRPAGHALDALHALSSRKSTAAIKRATGVAALHAREPRRRLTFSIGGQMPVLQAPTYS